MNEQEALSRMVAPGTPRPGKYRQGVIQILVTSQCDKSCFSCTQGSQLMTQGRDVMIPSQFEDSLKSLGFKSGMGNGPVVELGTDGEAKGVYWGVVGVFGGNPAISKHFNEYCYLLQEYVPRGQRGLWCNNPLGKGKIMRETFDPTVSNLNVHLDVKAYHEFRREWPESMPFGLTNDSRHSPPFVAMKDVLLKVCPRCNGTGDEPLTDTGMNPCSNCDMCFVESTELLDGTVVGGYSTGYIYDEDKTWELISNCDVNQGWSSLIGVFRGRLRAWFCELAGAQAMLHQHEEDYPDTGIDPTVLYDFRYGDHTHPLLEGRDRVNPDEAVIDCNWPYVRWWQLGMHHFRHQVRKHCHDCGIPLRGYGELSQSVEGREQVSKTHASIYKPKSKDREVDVVTDLLQLDVGKVKNMTRYLQNAKV